MALATPGRVEQVLDNLLANAIDASPVGATITVSTCAANGWAELHVTDEGPGLSETERSRAFDRFWQAHEGQDGFGLGLAIVQRLTAADGGDVELRAGSPRRPRSRCPAPSGLSVEHGRAAAVRVQAGPEHPCKLLIPADWVGTEGWTTRRAVVSPQG